MQLKHCFWFIYRIWIPSCWILTSCITCRIGFEQSKIDHCVWYRGNTIFFYYLDDRILIIKTAAEADKFIAEFKDPTKCKHFYDIEDCGDLMDYLGINFEKLEDGKLKLSQQHLIHTIVKEVARDWSQGQVEEDFSTFHSHSAERCGWRRHWWKSFSLPIYHW